MTLDQQPLSETHPRPKNLSMSPETALDQESLNWGAVGKKLDPTSG
jgi:hypothetical protein